jgi:hypothetical protein
LKQLNREKSSADDAKRKRIGSFIHRVDSFENHLGMEIEKEHLENNSAASSGRLEK